MSDLDLSVNTNTGGPVRKPVTAGDVKDRWDRGVRSTRLERQQAAVNGSFLRNRQWVYWNAGSGTLVEYPREPSRVRATVPRMGPDSRRTMAKLMRRSLSFDVPPSTPDDAAMRAARVAESALAEAQRNQDWEKLRLDHAWSVWEAGVAGLCVEWDFQAGTPVAMDQKGRPVGTGEVKLTVVSLHEIACEPGTRDIEHAYWWVRGTALPPPEVQKLYNMKSEPPADARTIDTVWRLTDGERIMQTPLTMVLTYYGRPYQDDPGAVITVVAGEIVDSGPWPYPFTDRLNIATAVVDPIHGRWLGTTPVTDAVGVQALYNASWSSIVEHMKLAGNARLWVPMGAVDDIEELSDTPGEVVEYNPINGAKPEYEAPPIMPDWWIRQPMMLENAMDDILGVHDVSRGEAPAGIESGVALSILSENDDTPVGALAKTLGEAWGRAASMVLQCWSAFVKDTRTSMVHLPGNVPEVMQWTGADMMGMTTAVVPLDSVMPRSRAAQAAYALQLFDRKIITNPNDLAKVADLPDQDDLVAGLDPDTARAQRENYWMSVGRPRTVEDYDDHSNHIAEHRDFMRSERYEMLDEQSQQLFVMHQQAHEQYAAHQAAAQAKASALDPVAGAVPTAATKPIDAQSLQQTAAIGLASLPAAQHQQVGVEQAGQAAAQQAVAPPGPEEAGAGPPEMPPGPPVGPGGPP